MQKKNRFGTLCRRCCDWTCQKWFAKLCAGDFLLDDVTQSGRPDEVDSSQIKTLIENSQHYITQEIGDILKIPKSSVKNHLYQLDYVNCIDVWVPHKLRGEKNLDYISACKSVVKTFYF